MTNEDRSQLLTFIVSTNESLMFLGESQVALMRMVFDRLAMLEAGSPSLSDSDRAEFEKSDNRMRLAMNRLERGTDQVRATLERLKSKFQPS